MLKYEQNFLYDSGGDTSPLRSWSGFSTLYYYILSRINIYGVKTMDIERFRWNNGVSGKSVVFIVRDKICW